MTHWTHRRIRARLLRMGMDPDTGPSPEEMYEADREIDRDRRAARRHVKCADGWTRRREDVERGTDGV